MKKISNIQYPIFLIFFVLFFSVYFILSVGEVKAGACYNAQGGCENVTVCGGLCPMPPMVSCSNDSSCPSPPPPASTKGLHGASGRLGDVGKEAGLSGTKPLEQVIGGYIKGALVLVGTVFLILMVYGGYIWMIARGDDAEVKRAKGIIETAVIGMAIVLAAYAITYFVVYRLTLASGVQV